ncbi:hypothetical protein [Spirillospora sp. NPDC029432]|uniref:hypothetical protein n=1 Tax=Spirillospora sp. NPDC029432 TaxID=3154599 RepID=UPI0034569CBA
MSGPNEAPERAGDDGTEPVPHPAPPSFGNADDPAAGDAGAPAELRLPIGLQKPWWASSPEASAEADTDPEAEPEPEGADEVVFGERAKPAEPAAPPGTLVAGHGAPKIDTRGAVPAEPVIPTSAPSFPDTDPDGIPVMRPDEPAAETLPEPPAPPSPETRPETTSKAEPAPAPEATPEAEAAPASDAKHEAKATEPGPSTEPEATPGAESWSGARREAYATEPGPALEPEAEPEAQREVGTRREAKGGESGPGAESEGERTGREAAVAPVPAPRVEPETAGGAAAGAEPQPRAGSETAGAPVLRPEVVGPASAQETRPQPVVPEGPAPTVITPVYHAEGGVPVEGGQSPFNAGPLGPGAPGTPGKAGGGRGRKPLLIGGGVVAAAVVAIAAFAFAGGDSDSKGRTAKAVESSGTKTAPAQSQAPAPGASPTADGGPPSTIDSARTDAKPLALTEAFPNSRIALGGRDYVRDRASVNHQCALTARGAMAKALTTGRCSSVVRVTFLDRERSLAVTSGIAVLPTKAGALKANGAGDPSRYEWFRGMAGERTKNIDRAGGYAASTVRGRYIAYAYATYADGRQPKPADPTLKSVAEQFVGYALRPVDARARG